MKPGKTITEVALAEFPGRRFPGKLVRTAEAINVTARTLLAEVDVANPTGTLLSGSYAEVHLKIPGQPSAIPFAEIKRVKRLLQNQSRLRTPPQ